MLLRQELWAPVQRAVFWGGGRVPLVPLMAPQGAIILSVEALKKPWNVQSGTAALSALREGSARSSASPITGAQHTLNI